MFWVSVESLSDSLPFSLDFFSSFLSFFCSIPYFFYLLCPLGFFLMAIGRSLLLKLFPAYYYYLFVPSLALHYMPFLLSSLFPSLATNSHGMISFENCILSLFFPLICSPHLLLFSNYSHIIYLF